MNAPPEDLNLGSLHAFLDPLAQGHAGLHAGIPGCLFGGSGINPSMQRGMPNKVPPGVPLPPRPQRQAVESMLAGDATKLNPKVAFKMLRSLGCPVKTIPTRDASALDRDPEAADRLPAFIEVSYKEQPVMFQMLLELGYLPQKSSEGMLVVRVEQGSHRTQEEAVAALSAPRQRKVVDEEPSEEPKARLSRQQASQLVNRLTAKRANKAQQETSPDAASKGVQAADDSTAARIELMQAADKKRFKSVEEQNAMCDRLYKGRKGSKGLEEQSVDRPPRAPLSAANGQTWPSAAAGDGNTCKDGLQLDSATKGASSKLGHSSSCGSAPGRLRGLASIRPSPRLAHAGLASLATSSSSSSTSAPPSLPRPHRCASEDAARNKAATSHSTVERAGQPKASVGGPAGNATEAFRPSKPVVVDDIAGDSGHAREPSSPSTAMADGVSALAPGGLREMDAVNLPKAMVDRVMAAALAGYGITDAEIDTQHDAIQSAKRSVDPVIDIAAALAGDLGHSAPDLSPVTVSPCDVLHPDSEGEGAAKRSLLSPVASGISKGAELGPSLEEAEQSALPEAAAQGEPEAAADTLQDNDADGALLAEEMDAEDPANPSLADQDTTRILDSILGPVSWPATCPGRPVEKRTKSQQQEALARLAKPRQVPNNSEADDAAPVAHRTARAQREACERLSAPRKPKEMAAEDAAEDEAAGGQGCPHPGVDSDCSAGEVQVVHIPSMLKQCTGPLERIEEVEEDRQELSVGPFASSRPSSACSTLHQASRRHLGNRHSSTTGSATAGKAVGPYAAPVVPLPPRAPAPAGQRLPPVNQRQSAKRRGGPSPRGDFPYPGVEQEFGADWVPEGLSHLKEVLAQFSVDDDDGSDDDVDGAEEMLGSIDQLYQELLGQHKGQPRYQDQRKGNAKPLQSRGAKDAGRTPLQPEIFQEVDSRQEEYANGMPRYEEPELLKEDLGTGDMAQEAASPEDKVPAQSTEAQFRELLEEVLWSVLLLRRGADKSLDVSARLLVYLPPPRLASCCEECGPNGLTESLLQRLANELPEVHAALMSKPPPRRRSDLQRSPAVLLRALREARDGLLSLAYNSTSTEQGAAWDASAATAPLNKASDKAACGTSASKASTAAPPASGELDVGADSVEPTLSGASPTSSASAVRSANSSQMAKVQPRKPRKSALSFWTPESIEKLEAEQQQRRQAACGRAPLK
mmetsp:Transcript_31818/g.74315  ORF Transcript_31818/g.74315 Transcript_31818/m.74315 type:complete len:1205 (+) Transcript_31818:160-3774(+)